MKIVTYRDEKGRKRRSMIKDSDDVNKAPYGIPVNPPDIERIDWDAMKQAIEDFQFEYELYSLNELRNHPTGMQAIITTFKRYLVDLYNHDRIAKSKSS